jgi:hypothetical protein
MGTVPRIRQLSPEVVDDETTVENFGQAAEVVDDFADEDAESELDEDFSELEEVSEPEDFSELDDFSPVEAAVAAAVLPLVRLSVA